ncbi:MAG: class I tRNA ligase family protein, partial [Candidatus Woesebacteria bacterium]|nr:class I tRNA ligase family protein [Candidatus Woesebacteria bacterium]
KSPFVKYWLHTAFLTIDGKKMSKSLENFYTVSDVEKKDFDPLALRYLYLGAHYRDPLNFTWDSLQAAQSALIKIKNQISNLKNADRTILSTEKNEKVDKFRNEFMESVNDDLNTPKALAVLWEVLGSNIPSTDKYDLAMLFDEVLGLKLGESKEIEIPKEVKKMIAERKKLREKGDFAASDVIRDKIVSSGFSIEDTPQGPTIKPLK